MAGYCSTGQSPQRAVVLMEEEEEWYPTFFGHEVALTSKEIADFIC
jgi:hypothetical protein